MSHVEAHHKAMKRWFGGPVRNILWQWMGRSTIVLHHPTILPSCLQVHACQISLFYQSMGRHIRMDHSNLPQEGPLHTRLDMCSR